MLIFTTILIVLTVTSLELNITSCYLMTTRERENKSERKKEPQIPRYSLCSFYLFSDRTIINLLHQCQTVIFQKFILFVFMFQAEIIVKTKHIPYAPLIPLFVYLSFHFWKPKTVFLWSFFRKRTRSSWPQVGGFWQISRFKMT